MNGYQRIECALRGEAPDRAPVMLHNFRAAARENGVTMKEFRRDPRRMAECFIRAVETYGLDGILVDMDTSTLAGAAGVPVDDPEDEPARCLGPRLARLEEVDDLKPVDLSASPRAQVWLEAVRILRRHFGDEVFVRGNCDQCPFSLASMIRSPENWMLDLTDPDRHELVFRLLDYCETVTRSFVEAMAEAGAHAVSNGDSAAGPELISPAMYRRFAQPYERRVAAHARGLGVPYILHVCGKTGRILEDLAAVGADGLELDHKTDAQAAHDALKDRVTFFGNLDPSAVLALGTPRLVEEKAREVLAVLADTPRFVLGAGCALPPATPSENIRALVRTAREFDRADQGWGGRIDRD